uniref:Uncharacterized protein n=1 Tax=Oryza punctata TaxID=4537 RepID=A0A0E0LKM3_ORYPU
MAVPANCRKEESNGGHVLIRLNNALSLLSQQRDAMLILKAAETRRSGIANEGEPEAASLKRSLGGPGGGEGASCDTNKLVDLAFKYKYIWSGGDAGVVECSVECAERLGKL